MSKSCPDNYTMRNGICKKINISTSTGPKRKKRIKPKPISKPISTVVEDGCPGPNCAYHGTTYEWYSNLQAAFSAETRIDCMAICPSVCSFPSCQSMFGVECGPTNSGCTMCNYTITGQHNPWTNQQMCNRSCPTDSFCSMYNSCSQLCNSNNYEGGGVPYHFRGDEENRWQICAQLSADECEEYGRGTAMGQACMWLGRGYQYNQNLVKFVPNANNSNPNCDCYGYGTNWNNTDDDNNPMGSCEMGCHPVLDPNKPPHFWNELYYCNNIMSLSDGQGGKVPPYGLGYGDNNFLGGVYDFPGVGGYNYGSGYHSTSDDFWQDPLCMNFDESVHLDPSGNNLFGNSSCGNYNFSVGWADNPLGENLQDGTSCCVPFWPLWYPNYYGYQYGLPWEGTDTSPKGWGRQGGKIRDIAVKRRHKRKTAIFSGPNMKDGGVPPREDCVALCDSAFGQGPFTGCHGGTYSGVQACDCDCCDQYVSWTSSGTPGFQWNPVTEQMEWVSGDMPQEVITYCSCGACSNGYNDCLNDCIKSKWIAASGDAHGSEKGWRKGGRLQRKRNQKFKAVGVGGGQSVQTNSAGDPCHPCCYDTGTYECFWGSWNPGTLSSNDCCGTIHLNNSDCPGSGGGLMFSTHSCPLPPGVSPSDCAGCDTGGGGGNWDMWPTCCEAPNGTQYCRNMYGDNHWCDESNCTCFYHVYPNPDPEEFENPSVSPKGWNRRGGQLPEVSPVNRSMRKKKINPSGPLTDPCPPCCSNPGHITCNCGGNYVQSHSCCYIPPEGINCNCEGHTFSTFTCPQDPACPDDCEATDPGGTDWDNEDTGDWPDPPPPPQIGGPLEQDTAGAEPKTWERRGGHINRIRRKR